MYSVNSEPQLVTPFVSKIVLQKAPLLNVFLFFFFVFFLKKKKNMY
jgi:hypothetical protein